MTDTTVTWGTDPDDGWITYDDGDDFTDIQHLGPQAVAVALGYASEDTPGAVIAYERLAEIIERSDRAEKLLAEVSEWAFTEDIDYFDQELFGAIGNFVAAAPK